MVVVSRRPAAIATLLAAAALALACDVARPVRPDVGPRCQRCHGGGGVGAAPPRSAHGSSDPRDVAVGAHERHLRGGAISLPVACDACHVVPETVAGHVGDAHATVTFGGRALDGGAGPRWDRAAATCSGVYCHGATLGAGGAFTAPVWTRLDGLQIACGGCHGYPPTGSHPQGAAGAACHVCHGETVLDDDASIDVAGGRHVNGRLDVVLGEGCAGCHGAPPDRGAHRAHANPASADGAVYGGLHVLEDGGGGGASYDFGCGHCHPIDPARHLDGTVDVELSPAGAAAGTLKARNASDAAYGAGRCDGVYCHSSGQAAPAYRPSPAWSASPGPLGCAGCHENPPRYPTGAPGSPTANSHLVLADDGFESGHFGGLPGPWHTSRHGATAAGQNAAPITCQTCHADTVDPAAAGPSGFYWLDTTGDYELPGGLLGYRCTDCHTGLPGEPPTGAGRVLPLRHVNGRPDVVFDARPTLPAIAWLPPAPNTPTRPYWVTNAAFISAPPDGVVEGSTLSLHLASARYDAATKTCTSVACHLATAEIVWGGANGFDACTRCHAF